MQPCIESGQRAKINDFSPPDHPETFFIKRIQKSPFYSMGKFSLIPDMRF